MESSTSQAPAQSSRLPLGNLSSRVNNADYAQADKPLDGPDQFRGLAPDKATSSVDKATSPADHDIVAGESNVLPKKTRALAITKADQAQSKRVSVISTASSNNSKGARRKSHIGPWQLGRTIGKGGCSRVRAVRHAYTGQYGAAKIIVKTFAETARAQSLANLVKSAETDPSLLADGKVIPFGLEREIVIMKLLEHRNIVRLYDVWENHNELYLIMEYVEGGELFHYIEEKRGLDEIEVVYLFRQIIAALLYCHRINIHHRDLKPENILLDRESLQVKLVDFGMAALQPQGKFLSTPCGSPHYAAPEVVSLKPYDGSKADVWSCGVILYVMLTGTPPFNYSGDARDIRKLWKLIETADYFLPPQLSDEAKDLIRRILVPQPARRISIEAIWHHPFLHKYDDSFGYTPENSKLEYWIGPQPRIEDWMPLDGEDIDREILRNLRTLWHSEKEETLVEKLLNDELNQEKYFYTALLKFRDDHLENYLGSPGGVGYSASDHHHVKRPVAPLRTRVSPPPNPRTKSQFSILNDEHLRPHSTHRLSKPPSSTGSYDPFRASREPSVNSKPTYVNVTVHRGGSRGSQARESGIVSASRGPGSLRVSTLRRRSGRSSAVSHGSASMKGSPAQRQGPPRHRPVSRVSLANPVHSSNLPIKVRPGSAHKRGVSFSHLRKGSATSGPSSRVDSVGFEDGHSRKPALQRPKRKTVVDTVSPDSSPTAEPQPIRSRKQGGPGSPVLMRPRHSKSPSRYIAREARKVSTELERVCEVAFFRSSADSSVVTTATDKPSPYETPPSSVSNRGIGSSVGKRPAGAINPAELRDRPLPALPVETPRTFINRELAETRDAIAARCAEEGGDNIASFHEVLSHLNRLLEPSDHLNDSKEKRISSAPDPRGSRNLPELPIISEESRIPNASQSQTVRRGNADGKRAFTDPGRALRPLGEGLPEKKASRVYKATSPPPVLPLNIIKRSDAPDPLQPVHNRLSQVYLPPQNIQGMGNFSRPGHRVDSLTPIDEYPAQVEPDGQVNTNEKTKKRSWFRRKISDKYAGEGGPVNNQDVLQQKESKSQGKGKGKGKGLAHGPEGPHMELSDHSPTKSVSTEFAMRDSPPAPGSTLKGGFMKLFRKRNERRTTELRVMSSADYSDTASVASLPFAIFTQPGSSAQRENLNSSSDSVGSPVETQQNWLARFLHIKPASKALCFQVGRGFARQEIVRLLREWKCFGVKDVSFDRKTNVIRARVDKNNHLKIKPVQFVAKLFVILEHGRRANLSVARFTQTRGAASSFRKVVDAIETTLANKGLLVEDDARRKEICEVFHGTLDA